AGSNVSVYLSQLGSRAWTCRALAKKYAPKRVSSDRTSYSLKCEGKTYKTLSRLIPDAVIPYRGRVYKRTKRQDSDTQSSSYQDFSCSGFILDYMPVDFFDLFEHVRLAHGDPVSYGPHSHTARRYTIQHLQNLRALHDTGFFHGDMKSENVMIRANGHLRLTDFGTTMLDTKENWRRKTGVTLPLKAPEMLIGPNEAPHYELRKPADLWTIGLTLYDMTFGTAVCALFNYARLSVILIHPHSHEGNTDAQMYSKLITFISEEKWPRILLIDPWHREKTEALKFIKRLLILSPFTRVTWHEIEEHPWIKDE
ncbi:hypothetical protein M422DRAFT_39046, partial [Sphaerobolus stellatus SS14]